MPERDTQLEREFGGFAQATLPYVKPPGADKALHSARIRRRARTAVGSVTAAIVLVPATILALTHLGGTQTAPPPLGGTSAPSTPTPTPPSGPLTTTVAVNGAGELANAALTLDWSLPREDSADGHCGTGERRFTNGVNHVPEFGFDLTIDRVVDADVDADGQMDIVAVIRCADDPPNATPEQIRHDAQVAVFKRGPAGYIPMGRVVRTGDPRNQTSGIYGLTSTSDGRIQVQLSACCYVPDERALRQWRGYAFTGTAFRQVSGPTTFQADSSIADVSVTAPDAVLSAPVNGFRTATLVLTVHNKGPRTATGISLVVELPHPSQATPGGDWGRCTPAAQRPLVCPIGDLAMGETRTVTLPLGSWAKDDHGQPLAPGRWIGLAQPQTAEYRHGGLEIGLILP